MNFDELCKYHWFPILLHLEYRRVTKTDKKEVPLKDSWKNIKKMKKSLGFNVADNHLVDYALKWQPHVAMSKDNSPELFWTLNILKYIIDESQK